MGCSEQAIDQQGDPKQLRQDSFWYKTIGPDYIAMAFETARRIDPEVILYYNDFDNEGYG